MQPYKLDRNAFKAHTVNEAADHAVYYKGLTWQERLRIASYLISVAYNFDPENPPRMDKTIFNTKSRQK